MARRHHAIAYADVQQLFDWMSERHAIYLRRVAGHPWPWTADPILQKWKFTNVFRELDRGTIALRTMEKGQRDVGLIVFNTCWYRMFNLERHATALGFVNSFAKLEEYVRAEDKSGAQMFTGCHMTKGEMGVSKIDTYLPAIEEIWKERKKIAERILSKNSLQGAFNYLLGYSLVGDFLAYELASDFRWSLIPEAKDRFTWASVHGGSYRGLRRLGMETDATSLRILFSGTKDRVSPELQEHFGPDATWPPFELRELEHSLCEFDKYERVRLGEGTPRQRYQPS